MTVLNRKLFNRGGPVSSRGVGITSGLATPKRGYVDRPGSYSGVLRSNMDKELTGDAILAEQVYQNSLKKTSPDPKTLEPFKFSSGDDNNVLNQIMKYAQYQPMFESLIPAKKPIDKLDVYTPSALKFFGGLMSGESLQGGLAGGIKITGEALEKTAPDLAQAQQVMQTFEEQDRSQLLQARTAALTQALKPGSAKTIKDVPVEVFNAMTRSQQENLLGINEENKDEQTIKNIPLSIFNKLTKNEQDIILQLQELPQTVNEVKGVPIEIFENLSQEGKNAIMGIKKPTEEKIKGIPTSIFNSLSKDKQDIVLGITPNTEEKINGIPTSVFNSLSKDNQNIILGVKSLTEETIKGIPKSTFNNFNDEDKAKILGLNTGVKDVKVTEVDGNQLMTWFEDDQQKQKVLGKVTPKDPDLTQFQDTVEKAGNMLNKPKNSFPSIISSFGTTLPSGAGSDVFTKEDIEHIQQRMTNIYAINTATTKEPTVQELAEIERSKNVIETIEKPLMQGIADNNKKAMNRKTLYDPILQSLETFQPGAFADLRLTLGKFLELVSPEKLGEDLIPALEALRVGNPVAGDILEKMSAALTLSIAQGGAIPGNLNTKEFMEIKTAGIPMFSTKEGAKIMVDLYKREDRVYEDAYDMMQELTLKNNNNEKLILTLPDGSEHEAENYLDGLNYIDGFTASELTKTFSGSDMYNTESLSERVNQMNRYDTDALSLKGQFIDDVPFIKGSKSAVEEEKDGNLKFYQFGETGTDILKNNPEWENKPIYIYNTNVYWKKDDPELIKRNSNDDPNDDVTVGNMIRVFWSPS